MWMLQKIVVGKQGYSVYNNMMVKITAGPNDAHRRLDRFLRQYFDKAPLSLIYKMIRKDVKVNGKRQSRETLLEEGDEICVYMTEEQADALRSTRRTWHVRKQFRVLYEDDQVLFTGKPFGLLTHGDRHEKKNTLVNQVEGYLMEKGDFVPDRENHFRPAAVNRLDRNTTGIVVFGKTQEALRTYTALMRDKEAVDKEYLAIVTGRIDAPLTLRDRMVRDERDNRSVLLESSAAENGAQEGDAQDGKWMETIVTPLAAGTEYTLVRVRILTGRTHQIRLHLSEAGHPILGDPKYGDPKKNAKAKEKYGVRGQLLHCAAMRFHDGPLAGKTVECPPPDTFTRIQKALFKEKATGNEGRKKTDR